LEGKCDARDVAMVYAWLKENPAKLEAYIGEEEWEEFQPVQVLSPEISGKLWNGIKKNTNPGVARYSWWRWMAVAASILLIIGLPWHYILKKEKTNITSAAIVAKTRNIFNNTLSKMSFTLSDGSAVELLPNSTLTYSEEFDALKRDVTLKGGANFNVAKDVVKPFTVYSNSVLTTVLGTRFTVKSYEANHTTIILHEGRVMIKISNSSSRVNKHEYYLTPGDIFILNKVNTSSRINNGERIAAPRNIFHDSLPVDSVLANLPSADSLSVRVIHIEKDKDDRYLFNNYPLDVVFDQLQVIYNTTIVYDKSKLGNRSFIGKIDKRDSLYTILKSIALLNNFSLRKQGDSILLY
jgi:ferric-dicitrate binding protein FerR (iron transport regulator)